jgi:transcriptional regulator with XRE-family HTH domain
MPTPQTLSDQVRAAVKAWPSTRAELARVAGVDPTALSRFASGERGLGIPDLDKLARALGLRVVPTARSKTRRKTR